MRCVLGEGHCYRHWGSVDAFVKTTQSPTVVRYLWHVCWIKNPITWCCKVNISVWSFLGPYCPLPITSSSDKYGLLILSIFTCALPILNLGLNHFTIGFQPVPPCRIYLLFVYTKMSTSCGVPSRRTCPSNGNIVYFLGDDLSATPPTSCSFERIKKERLKLMSVIIKS